MAILERRTDRGPVLRYEFSQTVTLLGRSSDCEVVVEDSRVSRHHAEIAKCNGEFILSDLRSSNGTFLNDRRVQHPQRLRDGDRIKIADVEFRYLERVPEVVQDRPTNQAGTVAIKEPQSSLKLNSSSNVQLRAVMSVSAALTRSLSLDEVLRETLNALQAVFPQTDRGFILLADARGELHIRGRMDRPTQEADRSPQHSAPISGFVTSRVMNSGEAILSLDPLNDDELSPSASLQMLALESLMCVPIPNAEGTSQGVIYLDCFDVDHPFGEDQLELLVTVAAIVGQAVENCRLHEQRLRAELMEDELRSARDVQSVLVPAGAPSVPGYELAHVFRPASELSGDYLDYVPLSDHRIAVAVGDVAGKGAPAALLVARMQTAVRLILQQEPDLTKAMGQLNSVLSETHAIGRFMTFVLAVLNQQHHLLTVVNAGHPSPLLIRDGNVINCLGLSGHSVPLGIDNDTAFLKHFVQLFEGDTIVFVTDGVSEALNAEHEIFGWQRLRKALVASADTAKTAQQTVAAVVDAIESFTGMAPQSDDICVLALRRL